MLCVFVEPQEINSFVSKPWFFKTKIRFFINRNHKQLCLLLGIRGAKQVQLTNLARISLNTRSHRQSATLTWKRSLSTWVSPQTCWRKIKWIEHWSASKNPRGSKWMSSRLAFNVLRKTTSERLSESLKNRKFRETSSIETRRRQST